MPSLDLQDKWMPGKTCSVCRKYKGRDEFYAHRAGRDGLNSWCKDCHRYDMRERMRERRRRAR